MIDRLARLLLGPVAFGAPRLAPDIDGLSAPGRPPQWTSRDEQKCRSIKVKPVFVEPFFNHVADDTHRPFAA